MSTIIKKQYETAKELLKAVEFNFRSYEICGRTQKDFDYFYDMATSLFTIVGNIHIGMKVCQAQRESGVSIIDECRQKFAAYEAELKALGLIDNKPKMKNEDLYTLERMDRMQEEKDAMYFERGYDYGC